MTEHMPLKCLRELMEGHLYPEIYSPCYETLEERAVTGERVFALQAYFHGMVSEFEHHARVSLTFESPKRRLPVDRAAQNHGRDAHQT